MQKVPNVALYSEYTQWPSPQYLSFGIHTLLYPRAGAQRTASFHPFSSALHGYASRCELFAVGLNTARPQSPTGTSVGYANAKF